MFAPWSPSLDPSGVNGCLCLKSPLSVRKSSRVHERFRAKGKTRPERLPSRGIWRFRVPPRQVPETELLLEKESAMIAATAELSSCAMLRRLRLRGLISRGGGSLRMYNTPGAFPQNLAMCTTYTGVRLFQASCRGSTRGNHMVWKRWLNS